jgi:hypothetical protein
VFIRHFAESAVHLQHGSSSWPPHRQQPDTHYRQTPCRHRA